MAKGETTWKEMRQEIKEVPTDAMKCIANLRNVELVQDLVAYLDPENFKATKGAAPRGTWNGVATSAVTNRLIQEEQQSNRPVGAGGGASGAATL